MTNDIDGDGGDAMGRQSGSDSQRAVVFVIAKAMAETGATSIKQMGIVMKAVQAKLAGKTVDGKTLSDKVRSKLS